MIFPPNSVLSDLTEQTQKRQKIAKHVIIFVSATVASDTRDLRFESHSSIRRKVFPAGKTKIMKKVPKTAPN